jgi:predicted nucleotidyltransferase
MALLNFSPEEIKQRLTPLFQDPGLQLALLFGSRVSGKTHPKSDIDIGVLFDDPVNLVELTTRIINFLHTDQVDVVDFRRASPLLNFAAARHGLLLDERSPSLFTQFYSLSFRRYVDTQKLRDAQKRSLQNFLSEKGLS